MASLYKRNGVWYCQFFENGKRKRVSLKTRSVQAARAKVVEIETAIEEGRPVGHKKDSPVDAFTEAFLKEIKTTKRPHTVKTLAFEWGRFIDCSKPIRLGDVTSETVTEYRRFLLSKGYAKSTVRSSLLALSSVFRTAIRDMHALQGPNPCKGVDLPKPDETFPRYLKLKEIDHLLTTAREHGRDMYLLIALGVFAGLRKNELINARWGWVDFKGRGRILVTSRGRFRTKSGRDRKVPLSSRLRAILDPYRGGPDEFIVYPEYPEKDGTETTYRVDFTEAFRTVCTKAGFGWVTPHKLRHTFASQHAQNGVSLYKIGQWAGHADPKTTQIYAHLSPEDDDIDSF